MSKSKPRAIVGVSVSTKGKLREIKEGEFDRSQAEDLAVMLVLLASKIRNASRYGLSTPA